jgi:hypothetical protein
MPRPDSSRAIERLHPGWTLFLPLFAFTALIICPEERRLYTALASSAIYALMQFALPQCRWRLDHYLCPVNIALFLLLLKLVVVPVLIMTVGAESRVITLLPSMSAMEGAVRIDTLAYSAFCLGLALAPQGPLTSGSPSIAIALARTPGVGVNWLFVGFGLIGFASAFGTLPRMVVYFLHPEEVTAIQQELDGTWTGVIAMFLRPFLAFALVIWWARAVDDPARRGAQRPVVVGLLAAIGITLANLTFSFNRAAFVFPLLCMAAVYSARIRRIPLGVSALVIAVILPVLIAVGNYRSGLEAGQQTKEPSLTAAIGETSENIQAYSGGPQYTGLFYDRIGWGERLYGGTTLLASIMSPVPILGKGFRQTSGPALFNYAIYGTFAIEDQIIPLATELFANFHAPGVMAGFVLLGVFLSQCERWFDATSSTFAAFVIQYMSLWAAMLAVWSISIYSQILIYFFVPIYFHLAMIKARTWLKGFRYPDSPAYGVAP